MGTSRLGGSGGGGGLPVALSGWCGSLASLLFSLLLLLSLLLARTQRPLLHDGVSSIDQSVEGSPGWSRRAKALNIFTNVEKQPQQQQVGNNVSPN